MLILFAIELKLENYIKSLILLIISDIACK